MEMIQGFLRVGLACALLQLATLCACGGGFSGDSANSGQLAAPLFRGDTASALAMPPVPR